MNGQPRKRVIVIGGGFAGLSTAAELSSLENVDVTLVEASDYLGSSHKIFVSNFPPDSQSTDYSLF